MKLSPASIPNAFQAVVPQRQSPTLGVDDDQLVIDRAGVPDDELDLTGADLARPHVDPEVLLADAHDCRLGRSAGVRGPARRGHGDEHRRDGQKSRNPPHSGDIDPTRFLL